MRSACIIAICAVTTIAAGAQTRDTVARPLVGTAAISGTVVAADESRTPVRRATLTLTRAGVGDSRTTATDDRGRFVFDSLPAGVYTLGASKGGYVDVNYGATRLGLPGSPIPLRDGQQFAANPISLVRGGVITGRLLDEDGKPVRGATVTATQFHIADGQRRRRSAARIPETSTTDARGVYRIYGLTPGQYLVSANSPLTFYGEVRQTTAAEIQWAQQQLSPSAPTISIGAPGRGGTPHVREFPTRGELVVGGLSFYPGTPDPSVATVVTVAAGEERSGIDFSVLQVPSARVSGIVIGLDGQPAANIALTRAFRIQNLVVPPPLVLNFRTGPDGRFVLRNVQPGDITIRAVSQDGRGALWGAKEVTVTGEDITGLTIQLQQGMTISGRIAFDAAQLEPPRDMSRISPRLVPMPGSGLPPRALDKPIGDDPVFTIEGVAPGLYSMTAAPPSGNWILKSIDAGGRNMLDVPFEIKPGQDLSNVTVTFTDRSTEVSGSLVDAVGRPTPQFFVLVYPVERAYWRAGSRWIKSVRAGIDGSFRITGLPAGEYYLCALTEVEPDQQYDPAYLEQFVQGSMKITLTDGEKRVQHLRIGGGH